MKLSAALATLATIAATTATVAAAPTAHPFHGCHKAAEGRLTIGDNIDKHKPNVHVHQSTPAKNNFGMLGLSEKETWAELWDCRSFNGRESSTTSLVGKVRIADDWCLEQIDGTGPVHTGLILQKCASGSRGKYQWFESVSEKFDGKRLHQLRLMSPDADPKNDVSWAHVMHDYGNAINFSKEHDGHNLFWLESPTD